MADIQSATAEIRRGRKKIEEEEEEEEEEKEKEEEEEESNYRAKIWCPHLLRRAAITRATYHESVTYWIDQNQYNTVTF